MGNSVVRCAAFICPDSFANTSGRLKTIGQGNSGMGITEYGKFSSKNRGIHLPRFLCQHERVSEDDWAREFGHGNFRKLNWQYDARHSFAQIPLPTRAGVWRRLGKGIRAREFQKTELATRRAAFLCPDSFANTSGRLETIRQGNSGMGISEN